MTLARVSKSFRYRGVEVAPGLYEFDEGTSPGFVNHWIVRGGRGEIVDAPTDDEEVQGDPRNPSAAGGSPPPDAQPVAEGATKPVTGADVEGSRIVRGMPAEQVAAEFPGTPVTDLSGVALQEDENKSALKYTGSEFAVGGSKGPDSADDARPVQDASGEEPVEEEVAEQPDEASGEEPVEEHAEELAEDEQEDDTAPEPAAKKRGKKH